MLEGIIFKDFVVVYIYNCVFCTLKIQPNLISKLQS